MTGGPNFKSKGPVTGLNGRAVTGLRGPVRDNSRDEATLQRVHPATDTTSGTQRAPGLKHVFHLSVRAPQMRAGLGY